MTSARTPEEEWLWGWDPTPGIVSVWSEGDGRVLVWRRIGRRDLVREEVGFRPWLVLDRLDDLEHLGARLGPEGVKKGAADQRFIDLLPFFCPIGPDSDRGFRALC